MPANAVTVKKAFIARLAAAPQLVARKVQVAYSPPRDPGRELIYLGRAVWRDEIAGGGDRASRMQRMTLELFVRVVLPGKTAEDADERAQEIGTVLEDLVVADIPGEALGVERLMRVQITGGEIANGVEEDGAGVSVAIYRVQFDSHLP